MDAWVSAWTDDYNLNSANRALFAYNVTQANAVIIAMAQALNAASNSPSPRAMRPASSTSTACETNNEVASNLFAVITAMNTSQPETPNNSQTPASSSSAIGADAAY